MVSITGITFGPNCKKLLKMSSFKSVITRMKLPDQISIFEIHSHDLMYLYQLRVEFISLSASKCRHRFLDTTSSICIYELGSESTVHLESSPWYSMSTEQELMETVQPTVRDPLWNKTDSTISLIDYNVISILIGPSKWAPETSTMYHLSEGTRPCPFPIAGDAHRRVTESIGD